MNLPADRRIDTTALRERIVRANDDGLPRAELDTLSADAASFLKTELVRMENDYRAAAPPGFDAAMLVRDACVAVSSVEGLWQADVSTVLGAAMSAAQLGLRIGVLGQCWILPFWSKQKRTMLAQLIIGYKGYTELCFRSGRVVGLASEIVYEREVDGGGFEFYFTERQPHLMHRPDIRIKSRRSCPRCNETDPGCPNIAEHGELIHAFYATARTKGGGFAVTRPWGLEMMREHRALYAGRSNRTGKINQFWLNEFPAAGRKTMIRELVRLLPKSSEVAHAAFADEGVRDTFSPNVQPGDATAHETHDGTVLEGHAEAAAEAAAEAMGAQTQHPADN